LGAKKFPELEPILEKYRGRDGILIPVLHEVQERVGYLPEDVQRYISRELNVPLSKITGVISFYSFFTTEPQGEHILGVCLGTACYVKGAEEIVDEIKDRLEIEEGETSADGLFTLTVTRCVGTCSLAPVVMVDDEYHGNVRPEEVTEILAEYQEGK